MFLVVFIINLLSISWMQIEQNLQGKKSGKVQKVESIGERKNTEPIEFFLFIEEFCVGGLLWCIRAGFVLISPRYVCVCDPVWSGCCRQIPGGTTVYLSFPSQHPSKQYKLISLSFDEGGLFKKERMMCNNVYYWECLILIFAFPPSTCRLTGEAILHGVLIDDITLWVKENALLHINALILEDVYFMKNNSFDIYLVLGR